MIANISSFFKIISLLDCLLSCKVQSGPPASLYIHNCNIRNCIHKIRVLIQNSYQHDPLLLFFLLTVCGDFNLWKNAYLWIHLRKMPILCIFKVVWDAYLVINQILFLWLWNWAANSPFRLLEWSLEIFLANSKSRFRKMYMQNMARYWYRILSRVAWFLVLYTVVIYLSLWVAVVQFLIQNFMHY